LLALASWRIAAALRRLHSQSDQIEIAD